MVAYQIDPVAVSNPVAIEKSVGSQLAVPMSLDIRRNSINGCYSKKFIVLKFY